MRAGDLCQGKRQDRLWLAALIAIICENSARIRPRRRLRGPTKISRLRGRERCLRDIVPVPGTSFGETLTSASPDLLREMIRGSPGG